MDSITICVIFYIFYITSMREFVEVSQIWLVPEYINLNYVYTKLDSWLGCREPLVMTTYI